MPLTQDFSRRTAKRNRVALLHPATSILQHVLKERQNVHITCPVQPPVMGKSATFQVKGGDGVFNRLYDSYEGV